MKGRRRHLRRAAGLSLEMPEDTLLNKSKLGIPAGEFRVRELQPRLMDLQDVRGAAYRYLMTTSVRSSVCGVAAWRSLMMASQIACALPSLARETACSRWAWV